jgi:hypothetical protein
MFLTNRKPPDSLSHNPLRIQLRKRLGADSDDLDFFLQESESSIPSIQSEEIKDFCKVAHSDHAGTQPASESPTIWLDDRSIDEPEHECTPRPDLLTASELEQALTVPVCHYTSSTYNDFTLRT